MSKIRRSVVALTALTLGSVIGLPAVQAQTSHSQKPVNEVIRFLSNEPTENADSIAIANGVIHARGVDHTRSNTRDELVFPDGHLWISHHTTKGTPRDTYDNTTCYGTYSERGTWRVLRGSGDYSDVTGRGHYDLHATFVGCDQNADPDYFTSEVFADGHLGGVG